MLIFNPLRPLFMLLYDLSFFPFFNMTSYRNFRYTLLFLLFARLSNQSPSLTRPLFAIHLWRSLTSQWFWIILTHIANYKPEAKRLQGPATAPYCLPFRRQSHGGSREGGSNARRLLKPLTFAICRSFLHADTSTQIDPPTANSCDLESESKFVWYCFHRFNRSSHQFLNAVVPSSELSLYSLKRDPQSGFIYRLRNEMKRL